MHNESDHEHSSGFDGFSMEEIEKHFSALAAELKGGGQNLNEVIEEADITDGEPIGTVMEQLDHSKSNSESRVFQGYDPTIKDFLARAETRDQCEEIISFCLKQGDISAAEAEQLRYRLEKGGPRAFGSRKPGYYDRNQ